MYPGPSTIQIFDLHSNPIMDNGWDLNVFGLFPDLSHVDLSQTGFKDLFGLLDSVYSMMTGIVISVRSNGIVDVNDALTRGYYSSYLWQSLARTV
jgi:hypothetical protein